MRSCRVNFEKSEIFRFLRGLKGEFPRKILNDYFAKNQVTPLYEKSNNKVTCLQSKNTIGLIGLIISLALIEHNLFPCFIHIEGEDRHETFSIALSLLIMRRFLPHFIWFEMKYWRFLIIKILFLSSPLSNID